ncbi:hypothetical protein Pmani_036502 [Petrolisthes manimaculis]|uniref:Uncharacterized protein n=1 Tax=Petrolisthes manimaculis TaxID=1843537 RepID=A0AAE1NK92_9EUCA|nr:hypothetical protein Pmani_036502 [Petrolisthes manimaculis]
MDCPHEKQQHLSSLQDIPHHISFPLDTHPLRIFFTQPPSLTIFTQPPSSLTIFTQPPSLTIFTEPPPSLTIDSYATIKPQ